MEKAFRRGTRRRRRCTGEQLHPSVMLFAAAAAWETDGRKVFDVFELHVPISIAIEIRGSQYESKQPVEVSWTQ